MDKFYINTYNKIKEDNNFCLTNENLAQHNMFTNNERAAKSYLGYTSQSVSDFRND